MPGSTRDELFENRYRIYRACALCKHGDFTPDSIVGQCSKLSIDIHKLGKCRADFTLDKERFSELGVFSEFLRE